MSALFANDRDWLNGERDAFAGGCFQRQAVLTYSGDGADFQVTKKGRRTVDARGSRVNHLLLALVYSIGVDAPQSH